MGCFLTFLGVTQQNTAVLLIPTDPPLSLNPSSFSSQCPEGTVTGAWVRRMPLREAGSPSSSWRCVVL